MMSRSDAISYLLRLCAPFAAEAALSDTQELDLYSLAADNSLRLLGVAEASIPSGVATDAQTLPYQALLLYFTLKQYALLFAIRVDVEVVASIKAARSQLVAQVQALMAQAAAECLAYGYEVTGPTFQQGRVTLDYLEPAASEFGHI